MKDKASDTYVLKEKWNHAEYIGDEDIYHRVKWRTVERIGFYIRPFQRWFFPCRKCQEELKNIVLNGTWIFGNKQYEPLIELNRDFKEIDDDSWVTLETHKATKAELKRLPDNEWNDLPLKDAR